ncbi:MAG: type II toxin-antitoxin system RelE/ParE family toxin [Candidatus Thiodiazotropha lotti]|nr:type II toxin-antitoxin system RelE/ParE family toxin [Candidatus Thiodiazotropha lotti]MCG7932232.1 type II toxin-antitoxin system RelE/ParE family toxin [Candidatus Thiodiazotropha lotti]MCG8004540.1 type II toxin-antitoxin system RelE/ParE family toxin [Candidatus Thiodiazotropha lotti]MCG8008904.1 type II toxin-antitoxin system RelE/ParE family toxin [Candidatus Thiodiazotropha lotti]MCG8021980.1 type II toxin-antitoxin system RelE/ParE family toxin [Candidatus Thiodiazotropha lotti]
MKLLQKPLFQKAYKKLHANQKSDLDAAIKTIMKAPDIGQSKTGDLSGVLVYKFKMAKQLTLLAYTYHNQTITLTLLALGTHENFYRDLKKSV